MKNEKRILIIPSWYPPDGGYFFKEHSEAIRKTGWQVDVLVTRLAGIRKLFQTGRTAFRPYRVEEEDGLRVVRSTYLKVPGNERYNIAGWARQTVRIYRKYVEQFGKPDLILAHSVTWAGFAAYLLNREQGVPYLVVEHRSFFVWSTEEARQMVKAFYVPLFERAYGHCNKLVLVSGSLRAGIEALVAPVLEKTMVIPNMIREDLFLPPPEPRTTNPCVFLWAGRLEFVKGLDLLLEAVKLLADQGGQNFLVRLAGRGSLREELERQAVELGISERVRFLGRLNREEMQKEMREASCFVLPSRYEAFGVVLIEAMATGLPVIATRSGGPDSMVNPENGLLIKPGDAGELAGAMQGMMVNIRNYSAGKIRQQTLDIYGEKVVMAQYNRLFLQVLGE
ncbi:MAG: glycosyltransferase [Bacteroidales bacterium]|nr:glycosyltransferase [Bacteroidales bacterium]